MFIGSQAGTSILEVFRIGLHEITRATGTPAEVRAEVRHLIDTLGAGGGYILGRDPADIKLSEILHALEGNCCLVECAEDPGYCEKIDTCPTFEIWKGATEMLKDYFERITLKDIVAQSDKIKKKARTKIR